jgi:hypothetical protein
VPGQQGPEINIPQRLNENLDQESAPQLEGATDIEDKMPLDGIFCPRVHRTPPPVGLTLVTLGNARRNVARRPPRYHTVVQDNCTIHRRTGQSNTPHPRLANNGAMACTE